MPLLETLRHIRIRSQLRKRFGPQFGAFFWDAGIAPEDELNIGTRGELVAPSIGLSALSLDRGTVIALKSHRELKLLIRHCGAEVAYEAERILLTVGGVKLQASTVSDVVTAYEIFGTELYRFNLPEKLLIFDLGMNVGMASLYMAKRHDCVVHGYELIPTTASAAQANVAMNDDLADRITINAFGLFDTASEFEVLNNPDARNASSLIWQREETASKKVRVATKIASQEMEAVIAQNPDRKVVIKIDTEGAEYEIVQELFTAGTLHKASLVMMEWHVREGKSVDALETALQQSGFFCTGHREPAFNVGFINAWKAV